MAVDAKLIKLAVDAYHGQTGEYSVSDSMEVLKNALIEANCGETKLNYKNIRDGKCNGLFAIIETIVEKLSEEGLKGDELFTQFIEDRNVALGDSDVFHVTKKCLFYVADVAEGTQGIRRQRLEAGEDIKVRTKLRAVKIYEELNRVLSGRVNFNDLIDAVSRSFTAQDLDEAYTIWASAMTTGTTPYVVSGTYNESNLLDIVEHVEAATGMSAIIAGTKKALRKVTTAIVADEAKSDYYNMGLT